VNLRPHLVTLLLLAAASALPAQEFEVAVIRPARSAPNAGTSFELNPGGRIKIVNEPIKLLIRTAFRLQNSQIAGAPGWLDSDRYDIEAQTGRPGKPTPDELTPLLQQLLATRFHLKFHKEMRETSVHALVPAKGGAKLTAAEPGEKAGTNSQSAHGTFHVVATASPMSDLASYIGNRLGSIVVDGTNLTGSYDFKLTWTADSSAGSDEASLITALTEQLGLRLEARKAPVEHLVIDSIERPSEN
jgi:uncharacterized protein (TIGR03435 family)